MVAAGATRLVAAGDWFALGPMPERARSRPETAALLAELKAADITFVNLEVPITRRGVRAEKQNTLRAHPGLVEDLLACGVDVAGLANNHMLDYGGDGLADTLETLRRSGIRAVGAGGDLEAARAGLVAEGPGGTVGFLAFASTLPQGFAASADRPGVAPIHVKAAYVVDNPLAMEAPGTPPPVMTFALDLDVNATVAAVQDLKKRADFVVVSAHWGVGRQDAIMDYQKEVGHALVDAGADLVLGHHPHRLHGVEFYRQRPILYSLGNFVFEPLPPSGNSPHLSFRGRMTAASVYASMRREGVLVDGRVRGSRLDRLALLPVLLDGDGYPMLRRDMAEHFASLMAGLSQGMGALFEADGGAVTVTMA